MSALLLGGENLSTRGNHHQHCSRMSNPIRIQCIRPASTSSADSGSDVDGEGGGGGVSALTAALRDSTQSIEELTIGSLPSHLRRGNPRAIRSAAPSINTASARLGVSLPVPRAPFLSARMKTTTDDIPEMALPDSAVGTDSATASTPQQYGSLRERSNFYHPDGGAASSLLSKNNSIYQLGAESAGQHPTLSQSLTAFDLMSRHLHNKNDDNKLKARAKPLERIDSLRDSGLSSSLTALSLLQGRGKSQEQTSYTSSDPNLGKSHHNEANLAHDEGTEASGDDADSDMCFEFDD